MYLLNWAAVFKKIVSCAVQKLFGTPEGATLNVDAAIVSCWGNIGYFLLTQTCMNRTYRKGSILVIGLSCFFHFNLPPLPKRGSDPAVHPEWYDMWYSSTGELA